MKYKYIFHTKDEKFAITLTSNADINFDKIKNKDIPLSIIDPETGRQVWVNLQEIVYIEKEVQDEENGS